MASLSKQYNSNVGLCGKTAMRFVGRFLVHGTIHLATAQIEDVGILNIVVCYNVSCYNFKTVTALRNASCYHSISNYNSISVYEIETILFFMRYGTWRTVYREHVFVMVVKSKLAMYFRLSLRPVRSRVDPLLMTIKVPIHIL